MPYAQAQDDPLVPQHTPASARLETQGSIRRCCRVRVEPPAEAEGEPPAEARRTRTSTGARERAAVAQCRPRGSHTSTDAAESLRGTPERGPHASEAQTLLHLLPTL